MQGELHESVTIEEFDEPVAALEAASACASHAFGYWVLEPSVSVPSKLLVQVFEDYDGKPDKRKKERAES